MSSAETTEADVIVVGSRPDRAHAGWRPRHSRRSDDGGGTPGRRLEPDPRVRRARPYARAPRRPGAGRRAGRDWIAGTTVAALRSCASRPRHAAEPFPVPAHHPAVQRRAAPACPSRTSRGDVPDRRRPWSACSRTPTPPRSSWPTASVLRAPYVVGADGVHSAVRAAIGQPFPGQLGDQIDHAGRRSPEPRS